MGLGHKSPQIKEVRQSFLEANAVLAWSHFYPDKGPDPKSFYKAIEKLVDREAAHSPDLLWQINAEHVRELLGPLVSDPREPRCPSKCFERHPNALRHLLVDATLVEAHVDQAKEVNEEHRLLKVGSGRERVRHVVYRDDNGSVRKAAFGYKLMVISDLATSGLPLIWSVVPANADERAETLRLLPKLFELYPELHELRDIHLTGDALYDHSEQFAYELVFRWGIHPVFPPHGSYGAEHEWAKTLGVPVCNNCGQLMKFKDIDKFPTPYERRKRGYPRAGEYVRKVSGQIADDALIRWKCPEKACIRGFNTYPRENPRLYTALPRSGDSNPTHLRTALLSYRNVIESGFAALKGMGLAGRSQMRPKWAEDLEVEWLLSLGLMSRAARRLVHDNGLYAAVEHEAESVDLLTQPTLRHPAPGPASRTPDEALAWHEQHIALARAPHGYEALDALDLPPCRPDGSTPYFGPRG